MLIYNFQKEFVGIDQADLEVFGFANLSELKAESTDFADMFIRTPGYIHNFKHVHWIDFVTCADPSEQSRVIIEVNGKTYKATIAIENIYLSDNPTSKAYLIHLNNLRTLTLKENGEFSEDIARKKPPTIEPTVGHAFNLSQEEEKEVEAIPELDGFKPFDNVEETKKSLETPEVLPIAEEDSYEIQTQAPTIPLDISFDDDDDIFTQEDNEPTQTDTQTENAEDLFSLDSLDVEKEEEKEKEKTIEKTSAVEEDDGFDYSYNYDPQVASDELGLPIDLIEEFIEDFIAQAKEFKDELFSSLDESDLDNIKVLSHKLKGVAANLRIEDAFNTLSIINTSSDISEVERYLNIFYKIIAKLSGEEIATTQVTPNETTEIVEESIQENDDDLYGDNLIIDFESEDSDVKNEEIQNNDKETNLETSEETPEQEDDEDLYLDFDVDVKDSDVPEKIEMLELADDDFLNEPVDDIDDLLSIDQEITKSDTLEEEIAIELQELDLQEEEVTEESIELPKIEYSKELIASEIGLDQESFNEIFDDYITDSQSLITSMRDAVSTNNFTQCKKEAIKLKGMSDNMRVNVFKDELANIIDSSDKDTLTESINKIDAVIAQISK